MTSQSLSIFCIELQAAGEWLCEVWWWLLRHLYLQNIIEHRFSWNKCFMIYQTKGEKKWCSRSQYFTGSQTKDASSQHLLVFHLWYNVTSNATCWFHGPSIISAASNVVFWTFFAPKRAASFVTPIVSATVEQIWREKCLETTFRSTFEMIQL